MEPPIGWIYRGIMINNNIDRFLNNNDQLVTWPKKHADKLQVLMYMCSKFECKTTYTEKQVNDIIKQWHTFQDWPLLRRGMIDLGLMTRDIEGHAYMRTKKYD